jgi:type I restriction enzyme S subunit
MKESKATVGAESASYTLLSLTKNGVIVRDLSQMKGKFPSDFGTYKAVEDGQIIFCLFDIDETPRTVGLSHHNGMITGAYDVFSISGINPEYLKYYYSSLDDVKAMRPLYTGLRKVIGITTFMQTPLPLPPRDEQDQIVRYLDWKVSQINRLINLKKRQIALLEEQKRTVINAAFANNMSWRSCKLKHLARFKSGVNLTSNDITTDGLYPVYGGNGLRGFYPKFSHDGEYLLVGRQGALCGNVHYVNTSFWATDHAITVMPYPIATAKWLFYYLSWMNLNQYSMAAAQPGLSVEYIINLEARLPTIEEQQIIAIQLESQCANTDKLICKITAQISLLHEYRTRLISDVVTGKLDVCGVEVPQYEAVEEMAEEDEQPVTESEE